MQGSFHFKTFYEFKVSSRQINESLGNDKYALREYPGNLLALHKPLLILPATLSLPGIRNYDEAEIFHIQHNSILLWIPF